MKEYPKASSEWEALQRRMRLYDLIEDLAMNEEVAKELILKHKDYFEYKE